jgi:hypothetical protein
MISGCELIIDELEMADVLKGCDFWIKPPEGSPAAAMPGMKHLQWIFKGLLSMCRGPL